MRRLVHIAADGTRTTHDAAVIDDLERSDGDWIWLDLFAPSDDDLRDVARRFELDRVARDDLFERQSPKFERLDNHSLLVLHGLAVDDRAVRTVELDLLIGRDWLVTVHHEEMATIDHVHERVLRPAFAVDGAAHLAARIAEFVGERYLPILDDLDAQVFDLEDEAVEGDPTVLADIHALRRDLAVLRRVLGPQRRVLEVVARNGVGLDERGRRDLNDALDHHARMVDSLDSAHQMVATLLDTYRGATAEKMNEVMKVLTVFSAVFLPLTLIVGLYGMNFQNMPELDEPWAYPATLGAMVVIAASLWLYFVRRGFVGGPKIRDLARPAKAAGRVGRGLASAATLPLRVTTQATRKVFSSETDGG